MPNQYFKQMGGAKPPPTGPRAEGKAPFKEKTAAWPGLPGKSGPNRSAGVKRAKVYPSSQGL